MGTNNGAIRSVMYVSRSLINGQLGPLENLRQQCTARNANRQVTGALYYDNDVFCQILEGDEQTLTGLLDRIKADPRHRDFRILLDLDVPKRMFHDWSMKFVSGISRPGMAEQFSYDLIVNGDPSMWQERAGQLRSA